MSLSKPKTMSRIQKSALRKVHREIARDLVPTNDFIAALREKKIFPDDLITLITVPHIYFSRSTGHLY